MLSFIWWLIKSVFKLFILLAIIVLGFFVFKDEKETIVFSDGSKFSLTSSGNWESQHSSFRGYITYLKMFEMGVLDYAKKTHIIINYDIPAFLNIISIDEASSYNMCKGSPTQSTDIIMPAGYAFYCTLNRPQGVQQAYAPSGLFVNFVFPLASNRVVEVAVDKNVWQQQYAEIYKLLKTATYTQK